MDALDPAVRSLAAGCCYAGAYLFAAALFWWLACRRGVATTGFRFVGFAGFLGGVAGAIASQYIVTQDQGRSIVGAFAGGYIAVVLAKRAIGLRRPTGDLFALALAGGEAVGRLGCFIGGCCYGKVASVPWAVYDHGAARHPTQLYSSLAAFATLALLLRLERMNLPEDTLLCVQGLLFCTARGTIDAFRANAPVAHVAGVALPFTVVQLACVGGGVFFALKLRAIAPQLLRRRHGHALPAAAAN